MRPWEDSNLATSGLDYRCSIQLSYRGTGKEGQAATLPDSPRIRDSGSLGGLPHRAFSFRQLSKSLSPGVSPPGFFVSGGAGPKNQVMPTRWASLSLASLYKVMPTVFSWISRAYFSLM